MLTLGAWTRFEAADKAAEAHLLFRLHADEFQPKCPFHSPANLGQVDLHRELRFTCEVDVQLEIRARVHRCGTSNLTPSPRQVAHGSDPGEACSVVRNGAMKRNARGPT